MLFETINKCHVIYHNDPKVAYRALFLFNNNLKGVFTTCNQNNFNRYLIISFISDIFVEV